MTDIKEGLRFVYCYYHFVCLALLHIVPYIPYVGPSRAIERRFIFIHLKLLFMMDCNY